MKKIWKFGKPFTTFTPMKKKEESPPTVDLVTIKVTRHAADNFKLAAAFSGKKQYEVSEEGSVYVYSLYGTQKLSKPKNNKQ